MEAPIVIGSDSYVIVRVPEGASAGELVVANGALSSQAWTCDIGIQVAENLYPVGNPAVDSFGNIYVTFSGSRGQKTPVSVYKIDLNYNSKPFVSEIMNATGLAFDKAGTLYVSSRYDGVIYQVTPAGNVRSTWKAWASPPGSRSTPKKILYVGDRSGTIFKISRSRQIYVFATLEPSIAAYHFAFGNDGYFYVTGPTTSSFDSVYRISPAGEVETYYRGLGRPQGLAFDAEGRLYVAASLGGRRGVVRFDHDRIPELFLSGPGIVGLAFTPSRALLVSTNNALYRVDVGIAGRPLPMFKMMPDAEIIAVGSELLTPQRLDTNSLYLTDQLNALGVEVVRKTVVGDERERLTDTILGAIARSQIMVLTGGLGPTEDDLTREAVAARSGPHAGFRSGHLRSDRSAYSALRPQDGGNNRRQAYVVEGAEMLPNDRGTAPGQWIRTDGAVLMLLPGPPNELKPMFEEHCLPRLDKLLPPQVIRTRWLRTVGMAESDLDQLDFAGVHALPESRDHHPGGFGRDSRAPAGALRDRAGGRGIGGAGQRRDRTAAGRSRLFAQRRFARKGDWRFAARATCASLSVAESATGGLLGGRITAVPSASDYFRGGFITYSDQMKNQLLGVPRGVDRRT